MRLLKVAVEHAESRSTKYPDYTNKRYGVTYTAEVAMGEDWQKCRRELMEKAIRDVRLLHGDEIQDVILNVHPVPKSQAF